jgi:ribonucleotide monophosphatase NagD (HAD superfamily)
MQMHTVATIVQKISMIHHVDDKFDRIVLRHTPTRSTAKEKESHVVVVSNRTDSSLFFGRF